MVRGIFVVLAVVALAGLPGVALSGSAHFVSCSLSVDDGQVCVTGKEAGLGNLDQIQLSLSVVAHCQNPGNQDPEAQNKETFGTTGSSPVQNGKALYELCLTPTFSPSCDPPMATIIDSVLLVDTTNTISCALE